MKLSVVNKSTILNRFVLHTLQRKITHLAVIKRKTNIKLGILKGGNWKRAILGRLVTSFSISSFRKNQSGGGKLEKNLLFPKFSSRQPN